GPPVRASPAYPAIGARAAGACVRASSPSPPRRRDAPGATWTACARRRSGTGRRGRPAPTAKPCARRGPSARVVARSPHARDERPRARLRAGGRGGGHARVLRRPWASRPRSSRPSAHLLLAAAKRGPSRELGVGAELLLDAQQLVVLGDPVRSRRRARL